ncbi:hypothetical protein HanXRQr2_Chr12g0560561 [Helianthus annuus]|uniref:Uncharacterized protein n=1 Tax=Helianthus annuus TaxID=4232 RepID=A0A9K3HJK3_HELAN|nr:hypothetical protein HanXRQr2_Chr12g0560561 [Helianthus annuus]
MEAAEVKYEIGIQIPNDFSTSQSTVPTKDSRERQRTEEEGGGVGRYSD